MTKETICGYIPVINQGYMRFFDRHPVAEIGVFDHSILERFSYLRKDIRALEPETVAELLNGVGRQAKLIGVRALADFMQSSQTYMPDDDISRSILNNYPDSLAQLEPVFLRWDRQNANVNQEIVPDRIVEIDNSDPVIKAVVAEAEKSSNWWRRVGAAIVDSDQVVHVAHNSSLPTEFSSSIDGDPRITGRRGESIETSIDIHAESRLIAQMAKMGVSIENKSIVVTTFPCPNCAKMISESGITSCYYLEGYAMLDGEDVMRSAGIELIKIDVDFEEPNPLSLKTYPTN